MNGTSGKTHLKFSFRSLKVFIDLSIRNPLKGYDGLFPSGLAALDATYIDSEEKANLVNLHKFFLYINIV